VIEVIVNCPTAYGRRNKLRNAADNIKMYKDQSVRVEQAKKMTPEELQGKIITGVLHHDTTRGEYTDMYAALVSRVQNPAKP